MTWSPAARFRACELWASRQLRASEIAAVIGGEFGFSVSKSSVIGVAYRAGLAHAGWKRPKPVCMSPAARARKYELQNAARREARTAAQVGLPLQPKPPTPPKPTPAAAAPKPPAPLRPRIEAAPDRGLPVSLGIPLVEIRNAQCRFIANDPAGGGATCCGHPVAHGSPWCAAHRAICVTGMVVRPSAWIPYARMRRAA